MSVYEKMTAIGDAIREKTGDTEKLSLDGMAETIHKLPGLIVTSASGETISLSDSADWKLKGLNLYGKTTQDGTPTPEAPVELVSAGNDGDITVTISGEDVENQTLTVSTPNGLAGVPVASGGNYTDNNGQQWICDEVDFARGVYVQRINTLELTGNEEWWTYSNKTYNIVNAFRYIIRNSMESDVNDKENCPVYSNYFERGGYVGKNLPTCIGVSEYKYVYLRFDGENDTITTIQQFSAWLASKKAEGNSVIVNYILATPIETPLSAEQLEAYASLHTNYPNTTIMNDGGAGMAVSYVASTKNYIDNQIAAVSAAIVNS